MINASDLVGRAVLTLSDATNVGHIDEVLFDPQMHAVRGFLVKTGRFRKMEAVARTDVTSVGRDAVTVSTAADVNDVDRLPALAAAKALKQAMGTKVVSESGDTIGTIGAIELDDAARLVTGYVLSEAWWSHLGHKESVISVQHVVRLGENGVMIVANAVAESLRPVNVS